MNHSLKMVFIGLYHRPNDPRLFHRQMRLLKQELPSVQLYFLSRKGLLDFATIERGRRQAFRDKGSDIDEIWSRPTKQHPLLGLPTKRLRAIVSFFVMTRCLRKTRPAIIQASDVREIVLSILGRLLTGATIIYDGHEDYFRQQLDYSRSKILMIPKALLLAGIEILFLRFFDAVFCTDDFLLKRYRRRRYGSKQVFLLRNFPPRQMVGRPRTATNKQHLELVYVGGVNSHRGVVETAKYVARFNQEHYSARSLRFTVYAPPGDLTVWLQRRFGTNYRPWIDYQDLMRELAQYDIGVCLWKNIVKFRRNLPMKNFDYMAAGLCILTSDFGLLKEYAADSGACICIDPMNYQQFKDAMVRFFSGEERKRFADSGQSYVDNYASFEREATDYVNALEFFLSHRFPTLHRAHTRRFSMAGKRHDLLKNNKD